MTSTASDFDFLLGRWTVRHRRLRERLVGCTEWDDFAGRTELRAVMGGLANIEDNVLELPTGAYRALALRSFDPATRRWAIWWLDGRNPHAFDQPVIGGFDGGVGSFYADDVFAGRPIRVRFLWSDITADTCRWQQAFSADGGRTWETNWIMTFARSAADDTGPL